MSLQGLFRALPAAILIAAVLPASPPLAEQQVRVATYNIEKLDTEINATRQSNLLTVIAELDADVIGLQEIDDRAALAMLFPPNDWHLVIDDESGITQDVAVAVRKPFRVLGFDNPALNADDENFLFPDSTDNSAFPQRRDVLFVRVGLPDDPDEFIVMVVHAKSRYGGRADTDSRRVEAARELAAKLESEYDGKDYILVGDFNDNPDDSSMNILETGDPTASIMMEETLGTFLINLTEPLCAQGHVSHGRSKGDLIKPDKQRINTIDTESRLRNYTEYGSNTNTGDILFDQILIPVSMNGRYVPGSAKVFDHWAGVYYSVLSPWEQASDHLPVYADFIFGTVTVRIVALLPDPVGSDTNHETVTLQNGGADSVDLTGWVLRDKADNAFELSGSLAAGETRTITIPGRQLPLNQSGDEVWLTDDAGEVRDHVAYTAEVVEEGATIKF